MDSFELFKCMRRVAAVIHAKVAALHSAGQTTCQYRYIPFEDQALDPLEGQTLDGLFLEVYYGMPLCLHTPWGAWHFATYGVGGQKKWEAVVQELLPLFKATLSQPATETVLGVYGPIYALHEVDGVALPTPCPARDAGLDRELAVAEWDQLAARYASLEG